MYLHEPSARVQIPTLRPYNFDEGTVYTLQLLKASPKRRGWVVVGRGSPTLERLRKWKKILDSWHQAFRIGQRLPNGQYRYAFCASTPDIWIKAGIRYLENRQNKPAARKRNKRSPERSGDGNPR